MNTIRSRLAPLVITVAVAACGDGTRDHTTIGPAQPTAPPARSVAEHSAARAALAPLPGTTAAQRSAVRAATQEMALEQLAIEMPIAARTALAAPSLVHGHVNLMRQAAAGTTLTELDQRFPLVTDTATNALLGAPLSRQMVGAPARRLLVSFLDATDGSALPTWLAAWRGSEADFSAGAPTPPWPAGAPDLPTDRANLRLAVLDRLDLKLAWPAQPVEAGVFGTDTGHRLKMNFIRLRQGVLSTTGADYRADFLRQGARTLVMIRPDVSDFGAWVRASSGGLGRALSEAAQAIAAPPAGGAAGELLLPVGSVSPPVAVTTVMWRRSVALPYSEVQANFGNLDGNGGTYAVSNTWRATGVGSDVAPTTALVFRADGTDVLAQHLTSFVFSPQNVNGPGTTGSVGTIGTIEFTACPHSGVDLQRYVLAQLDDTLGWLWVATFTQAPGGVTCINFETPS